jgi:hypothetical protein
MFHKTDLIEMYCTAENQLWFQGNHWIIIFYIRSEDKEAFSHMFIFIPSPSPVIPS